MGSVKRGSTPPPQVWPAIIRCFSCGQVWATRYFYLEAWRRRPRCCGRKMWASCPMPWGRASLN